MINIIKPQHDETIPFRIINNDFDFNKIDIALKKIKEHENITNREYRILLEDWQNIFNKEDLYTFIELIEDNNLLLQLSINDSFKKWNLFNSVKFKKYKLEINIFEYENLEKLNSHILDNFEQIYVFIHHKYDSDETIKKLKVIKHNYLPSIYYFTENERLWAKEIYSKYKPAFEQSNFDINSFIRAEGKYNLATLQRFAINSNLNVYEVAHQAINPEFDLLKDKVKSIGNIFEKSLKEILNKNIIINKNSIKNGMRLHKNKKWNCENCDYINGCEYNGVGHALNIITHLNEFKKCLGPKDINFDKEQRYEQ